MMFHVRCTNCRANWWTRGDYEPDTNATVLDVSVIHDGECACGSEVEIIEYEYEDYQ